MGLGIAFVVGGFVIRTVHLVDVVALVISDFVVDVVILGADVLGEDGSFVGLEKISNVDGPKI